MSNNNKVKGILKGLRFISQIFDNDGKEEIQIGHPTDVKHVAHIGWDGQTHGPSDNNPSWMNEFKSVPGNSSAQNHNGDILSKGSADLVQRTPDGSMERGSIGRGSMERGSRSLNCQGQEDSHSHELSKQSKKQSNSMGRLRESHAKGKSDKPRNPKKQSKHAQPNDSCNDYSQPMHTDADSLQLQGGDHLPPKKSRHKISKEHTSNVGGGSSKSRSKHDHHYRDTDSNEEDHSRSSSKSKNKHESFEEDWEFERETRERVLKSCPN